MLTPALDPLVIAFANNLRLYIALDRLPEESWETAVRRFQMLKPISSRSVTLNERLQTS